MTIRATQLAENRRERTHKVTIDSPYLLVNREAFQTVNRINRLPGILNESGWTIWSYHVEGLRTFEGDGSRWIWREASMRSWSSEAHAGRRHGARSIGLILASILITLISVFGLVYGLAGRLDNFSGASILAFSAVR